MSSTISTLEFNKKRVYLTQEQIQQSNNNEVFFKMFRDNIEIINNSNIEFKKNEHTDNFSIMTYNVHMWKNCEETVDNFEKIMDFIKNQNCDVVCL